MIRTGVTAWILIAVSSCVGGSSVFGQPTEPRQPGVPVILFDGLTTNGWTRANGQPHNGWVVEDGALHRKKGGGDLYHTGVFRDFELHFQWKISKGGNSGLKYRVQKYGNRWLGCEYQILDDQNARERNKSGCLYDVYEPVAHKPAIQHDVWHFSKIVVCGNRIEHWLNGVLIVQAHVGGDEWKERVAKSKFRGNEGFGENREGRIFLQDHGNPVWYRHIILIPLNCDSPTTVSTDTSGHNRIEPSSGCSGCSCPSCRGVLHRSRRNFCKPACRPALFLRRR